MPKIFKDYLYQRYIEDIIIYSFGPLIIVLILSVRHPINLAVLLAVLANYLMYCFSFMYNDIEDRIEDANSPGKRFKNPFGYKVWSLNFGYLLLSLMALISLVISMYVGGILLTFVAFSNLLFGVLYSIKSLRLKNYPIIDFFSHAYLLAAVQGIYFLLLPESVIDPFSVLVVLGLTLISIGGDLENEYRDYEDDQKAGLKNTANYLGKANTYKFSRSSWGLGVFMIGISLTAIVLNILGIINI